MSKNYINIDNIDLEELYKRLMMIHGRKQLEFQREKIMFEMRNRAFQHDEEDSHKTLPNPDIRATIF